MTSHATPNPRLWVLMEHDHTRETAMVLVPTGDPLAAERWGQDCDRGQWNFVAVFGTIPQFLMLAMFDARELERDPKWYRKTENLNAKGA